jgi:hypothetical protein
MIQNRVKGGRKMKNQKAETIQGWTIDLRAYKVPGGTYDVKGSLASLLFNGDQKLTVDEALDNKVLADKIRKAGDSILLDRMDFARIRRAYSSFISPTEDDLEMFRRIKEAASTEVGGD